MATFNTNQLGMGIFLLLCSAMNAWFVYIGVQRVREEEQLPKSRQLLGKAVLAMALFDVPWVWGCMVQCVWNTFRATSSQAMGDDSAGCILMGLYSTASLFLMMGSHCLVAFYLRNCLNGGGSHKIYTNHGFWTAAGVLFLLSWVFGTFPLMEGGGYRLSSGGFCYANFTRAAQASMLLVFVLFFLSLSTYLWTDMGMSENRWAYYVVFALTWLLWVPACIYGIAHNDEIAYPYMIIGGIAGHGNAIANPILYGILLFQMVELEETCVVSSPEDGRAPQDPCGSEESEYGLAEKVQTVKVPAAVPKHV